MPHAELEMMLDDLKETEPRKAAEVAYVLARLHSDEGEVEQAIYYGRESLRLFDQCKMETMEDCAAWFVTLSGIALPSIIHQDVVRDRLKPLKL